MQLGARVMVLWMNSPGHKANILEKAIGLLASAVLRHLTVHTGCSVLAVGRHRRFHSRKMKREDIDERRIQHRRRCLLKARMSEAALPARLQLRQCHRLHRQELQRNRQALKAPAGGNDCAFRNKYFFTVHCEMLSEEDHVKGVEQGGRCQWI